MIRTRNGTTVDIVAVSPEKEWVWVKLRPGGKQLVYYSGALRADNGWPEIADAIGKVKATVIPIPEHLRSGD